MHAQDAAQILIAKVRIAAKQVTSSPSDRAAMQLAGLERVPIREIHERFGLKLCD